MKLKDKTTLADLKKLVGKKFYTRTRRKAYTITDVKITDEGVWLVDGKKRIPLKWVKKIVDPKEEKPEPKPKWKSPIREAEEQKLKKEFPAIPQSNEGVGWW